MASNDSDIIREVRGLTDCGVDIIPGNEMQTLVDIGKEEIRADVGEPGLTFYASDGSTFEADRALFWFVCLATKVKTGEIASTNIEIESLITEKPAQGHFDIWFENLEARLRQYVRERQDGGGAAHTLIEREDDRSYSYDQ